MKVKIYGKSNCKFCVMALDLATHIGAETDYVSVDDPVKLTELKELLPDVRTVPQIYVDDVHIGGFDDFSKHIEGAE